MKILCVDDDIGIRLGMRRLLTHWGHSVEEATSGEECLEAMRAAEPPRLIILDWVMPDGMDGIEVARKIRSDPEMPYAYIILVTGRNTKADMLTALDSGADEFIAKPCDPVELQSRVRVAERILARIPKGWSAAPEIQGYRLDELLGEGAFGIVYKAKQIGTDRIVAVKLRRTPLKSRSSREDFLNEARLAAMLDHPNIVRIFDFRTQGEQDYYAMEYVDGTTLASRLEAGPLKREEVFRLMIKICDAVDYAHRKNVVHRDLKPTNIMLDLKGEPKVADFGLAKAWISPSPDITASTATYGLAGTPAFMSPEQARGRSKEIGPATDVYALGVMLYVMILGRFPYENDTSVSALLAEIRNGRIVAPRAVTRRVPPRLEAIILRALAHAPADRFSSPGVLADALRRYRSPARSPRVGRRAQAARVAE